MARKLDVFLIYFVNYKKVESTLQAFQDPAVQRSIAAKHCSSLTVFILLLVMNSWRHKLN